MNKISTRILLRCAGGINKRKWLLALLVAVVAVPIPPPSSLYIGVDHRQKSLIIQYTVPLPLLPDFWGGVDLCWFSEAELIA